MDFLNAERMSTVLPSLRLSVADRHGAFDFETTALDVDFKAYLTNHPVRVERVHMNSSYVALLPRDARS
jgi:hypothetical protein